MCKPISPPYTPLMKFEQTDIGATGTGNGWIIPPDPVLLSKEQEYLHRAYKSDTPLFNKLFAGKCAVLTSDEAFISRVCNAVSAVTNVCSYTKWSATRDLIPSRKNCVSTDH